MAVRDDLAKRREGKRLVQLSFQRSSDSRREANIVLMIQDDDMEITELLEMAPKDFADLVSGLATWIPDGLAGHRDAKPATPAPAGSSLRGSRTDFVEVNR